MELSEEEKWDKVKRYYERYYFDPHKPKLRFRFAKKPDAKLLTHLFDEMERALRFKEMPKAES